MLHVMNRFDHLLKSLVCLQSADRCIELILSKQRSLSRYTLLLQNNPDEKHVGSLLSGAITPKENGGNVKKTVAVQAEDMSNYSEKDDLKSHTADTTEDVPTNPKGPATFWSAWVDMFTKFEVNVLVYLLFFMYVTHTCLQGITPLVAEKMLDWNETKVSIVYTVWGLEIIIVLIVVWLVSPKIADRVILLLAVLCGALASISLIVLSYSSPGSKLCYYSFLVTIFLGGVGISITVVVGRSLVSKHTSQENQGLVHAILTSFNRLAGLLGPIFGSSLYTYKTLMGCLIAGVQFLGLILVIAAFRRLKVVDKK